MKKSQQMGMAACFVLALFVIGCVGEPTEDSTGGGGSGKADEWGECVAEGQGFEDFNVDGHCCEGLVPVQASVMGSGGCTSPRCPCFVCTACGDGVCGAGENECNCAEDCAAVPECVGEGQGFESFETEGVCCEGLVPIPDSLMGSEGCTSPRCPCFVCAACGDGVCGAGENECSCPDDCA